MTNRFHLGKIAVLLAVLLTSIVPCRSAPRLANTAGWVQTPFERNPFLFTSEPDAIQALSSKDILMRRSAVEWMGQWTGTYTAYGISPNEVSYATFRLQAAQAVPSLTRALHEMPDGDSLQAARLLNILGTSAKSAIPALCAELSSPDYGDGKPADGDDFVARADLLNSLTHLCGGVDSVAPTLAALMQNREPETRRAAAAAVQFCTDPMTRNRGDAPEGAYSWMPPEKQRLWHIEFHKQIMPALTGCVDDPVTAVRLAALMSLQRLTYDSADAPWQTALAPLSHALSSSEANQCLSAAQVLAYAPTDVSSAAASLRTVLHKNEEAVRPYVLSALAHAAWSSPAVTLDAFLPDLSSANVEKRRLAAADIQRAVGELWGDDGEAGYEPLLDKQGFQDNVYMARMTGWSLEVDKDVPPAQSAGLRARRHKAGDTAKTRLLTALAKAAADPDHVVRVNAGSSLEHIGKWTDSGLSGGYWPNPAVEAVPEVEQALAQAAASLQHTEPDLAKRLLDLKAQIQTSHSAA